MRRFLELQGRGVAVTEEEVLADIRARDERDSTRGTAPLKQASDAVLLDTTNLSIDAAFRAALDLIEAAMSRAGRTG
jgi:cytidylate kinase